MTNQWEHSSIAIIDMKFLSSILPSYGISSFLLQSASHSPTHHPFFALFVSLSLPPARLDSISSYVRNHCFLRRTYDMWSSHLRHCVIKECIRSAIVAHRWKKPKMDKYFSFFFFCCCKFLFSIFSAQKPATCRTKFEGEENTSIVVVAWKWLVWFWWMYDMLRCTK